MQEDRGQLEEVQPLVPPHIFQGLNRALWPGGSLTFTHWVVSLALLDGLKGLIASTSKVYEPNTSHVYIACKFHVIIVLCSFFWVIPTIL